jgi:hypothetical protein
LRTSLHVIWFLASATDAIADIIIAAHLFRLKKKFGNYLGWMMVGLSIESVIAATSLILFWMVEIDVAPVFAITRTIGRSIKAFFSWTFCAYLLYWVNGDMGQEHTRSPDK